MLTSGDKIDDYRIVAQLTAGGMAALYLAEQVGAEGFSRPVAIKVIHPHLSGDTTFVRMFIEEARLSARIRHPNVVHVEKFGQCKGFYFLAMEYVHGCSLAQLLRTLARLGHRLAPELAVAIALGLADGLHAAHETRDEDGRMLGVVHRDVSPHNVLLASGGHVKLIDFGIAKAYGAGAQTRSGSLRGKIGYMSPEQARGHALDRRSDVYALGLVLWEMLTMRRALAGETEMATLDLARRPRIPPPSRYAPGLRPELDAAVMRALAVRADDRTATAHDFRRQLAAALPAALSVDALQLSAVFRALAEDEVETGERPAPEALSGLLTLDSTSEATANHESTATATTLEVRARGRETDEAASAAGAQRHEPVRERRRRTLALAAAIAVAVAGAAMLAQRQPPPSRAAAPRPAAGAATREPAPALAPPRPPPDPAPALHSSTAPAVARGGISHTSERRRRRRAPGASPPRSSSTGGFQTINGVRIFDPGPN